MERKSNKVSRREGKNKGFSLIELIIVITIMAILTTVLAPQLLRYVEKAREAKDRTVMDEVVRAIPLALVAEGLSPSGRLWYTADGRICNVSLPLVEELAKILGGTYAKDGSYYTLSGMPPLSSKLYKTNPSSDSRAAAGSQVFLFTQIKKGAAIIDYKVVYENNPVK